jgi:hypothetical protein
MVTNLINLNMAQSCRRMPAEAGRRDASTTHRLSGSSRVDGLRRLGVLGHRKLPSCLQLCAGESITVTAPLFPLANLMRHFCYWTTVQATPEVWRAHSWPGFTPPCPYPLQFTASGGLS